MAGRQEFDRRARAIEDLVRRLESGPDPGFRATARELVQALMELHRTGLERALEVIDESGESGAALIDRLAGDEIVKHLMVLHGLHPLDLEARVRQAVANAREAIASRGGVVESVVVSESGAVTIALGLQPFGAHGCGSPAATLTSAVEEAIYESAPDITSLSVEVRDEGAAAAFVPIGNLRKRQPEAANVSPASERSAVSP